LIIIIDFEFWIFNGFGILEFSDAGIVNTGILKL